jgi:hypothetical protein
MKATTVHDTCRFMLYSLVPGLERTLNEMNAFTALLETQPMPAYLKNLAAVTDRIGSAFPKRPVEHRRYALQWAGFIMGTQGGLDEATARYLCWEPAVATDGRFLTYLLTSGIRLNRRPLAGLVRSSHQAWNETVRKDFLGIVPILVRSYDGPSPVILKWKYNIGAILSDQGPEILGRLLVEENRTFTSLLEEWYLDPRSPFVGKVVEAAAAVCRTKLGTPTRPLIELLFHELLPWPGWEPRRLREEVGELILESSMTGQVREILQRFVLICKHLGDPRLDGNQEKWADVPKKARDRVLVWLTQNPFRLLEQVYQEGRGWVVRPWGEGKNEGLPAGIARS